MLIQATSVDNKIQRLARVRRPELRIQLGQAGEPLRGLIIGGESHSFSSKTKMVRCVKSYHKISWRREVRFNGCKDRPKYAGAIGTAPGVGDYFCGERSSKDYGPGLRVGFELDSGFAEFHQAIASPGSNGG